MEIDDVIDGRYRVVNQLGQDELSVVYLAHDLILDRQVTIKVLKYQLPQGSEISRNFERVAAAVTILSDPQLVMLLDVGNDHGRQYLVREYIPGVNLRDFLRSNFPISLQQVQQMMGLVLDAVDYAHNTGFIHGNLTSRDILIANFSTLKVANFGLVNAISRIGLNPFNSFGIYYRAPEELTGGVATVQSDLYSLGIILFELLNGSLPFENEISISEAITEISSIRKRIPSIPQSFENIITRATARFPSNRYQTAAAMKKDLITALNPERFNEPKLLIDDAADNANNFRHPVAYLNDQGEVQDALSLNSNSNILVPAKKVKKRNLLPKKWLIISSLFLVIFLVFLLVGLLNSQVTIEVPEAANLSPTEAIKLLRSKKLAVSPKVDHASDAKIPQGRVIKTDPIGGTSVKQGSSVRLIVSSGLPKVKVSNFQLQPFAEVKDTLERLDLKVEALRKYSDTVGEGMIITQNLAPGTRVKVGTTIILTVSKGVKPITMVNLIGSSAEQVIEFANESGLNQVTDQSQYSDLYPAGMVLNQDPAFGAKLKKGDSFHVAYSLGPKPRARLPIDNPKIKMIDLTGQDEDQVKEFADKYELKVVVSGHQYSDKIVQGTVIEQRPEPNSLINKGETIYVTYSLGPEPNYSAEQSEKRSSSFDYSDHNSFNNN